MTIFNINGIPENLSNEEVLSNKKFYVTQNHVGEYSYFGTKCVHEIEDFCIELRKLLSVKFFGSIEEYYRILEHPIYPLVAQAGIDAEVKISKIDFEKFIYDYKDKQTIHKLLYFFDIDNLIGTLQNGMVETQFAVGEFYKQLNINSFLIDKNILNVENGIQYASGSIVTNITSISNRIFICLYSMLDFVTKIIHEVETLQTDFKTYPKLKSKNTLLVYAKRTKFHEMKNTVFEKTNNLRMIEYLRNEIIHNASIDGIPKVYQIIENKMIVEKFILLPDFSNGQINTLKNRKRFFDDDTKLNEILPNLINDYFNRMKFTMNEVNRYCR